MARPNWKLFFYANTHKRQSIAPVLANQQLVVRTDLVLDKMLASTASIIKISTETVLVYSAGIVLAIYGL